MIILFCSCCNKLPENLLLLLLLCLTFRLGSQRMQLPTLQSGSCHCRIRPFPTIPSMCQPTQSTGMLVGMAYCCSLVRPWNSRSKSTAPRTSFQNNGLPVSTLGIFPQRPHPNLANSAWQHRRGNNQWTHLAKGFDPHPIGPNPIGWFSIWTGIVLVGCVGGLRSTWIRNNRNPTHGHIDRWRQSGE